LDRPDLTGRRNEHELVKGLDKTDTQLMKDFIRRMSQPLQTLRDINKRRKAGGRGGQYAQRKARPLRRMVALGASTLAPDDFILALEFKLFEGEVQEMLRNRWNFEKWFHLIWDGIAPARARKLCDLDSNESAFADYVLEHLCDVDENPLPHRLRHFVPLLQAALALRMSTDANVDALQRAVMADLNSTRLSQIFVPAVEAALTNSPSQLFDALEGDFLDVMYAAMEATPYVGRNVTSHDLSTIALRRKLTGLSAVRSHDRSF
jgi:hypothetical protein